MKGVLFTASALLLMAQGLAIEYGYGDFGHSSFHDYHESKHEPLIIKKVKYIPPPVPVIKSVKFLKHTSLGGFGGGGHHLGGGGGHHSGGGGGHPGGHIIPVEHIQVRGHGGFGHLNSGGYGGYGGLGHGGGFGHGIGHGHHKYPIAHLGHFHAGHGGHHGFKF